MSQYTTEVRYICETAAGYPQSAGFRSVSDIINKAVPNIFDFDFPLFDDNYRSILCGKILLHYYTREIAFETVALWKLKLDTMLNDIMPYYNQLYKSELLEFNPLYDFDLTRSHTLERKEDTIGETTGNATTSVDGKQMNETTATSEQNTTNNQTVADDSFTQTTGNNYDKYSDTPQGSLTNVKNDKYLTNARMVEESTKVQNGGESTTTGTATSKGITNNTATASTTTTNHASFANNDKKLLQSLDDYIERVQGRSGSSGSTALKDFRSTFLNIDLMVIEELSDLFFTLY